MHLAAQVIALALAAFPAVLATNHTECYNYFLKKDGCVWSAADDRNRCDENGKPPKIPVSVFKPHNQLQKRGEYSLDRRYTSVDDTTAFPIGGGDGICGPYTTDQPGACLWVGSNATSGDDPNTAGWVNGARTSNCGKQLYIERVGHPKDVLYVPVVDGCSFFSRKVEIGCFQIAVTNRTFYDLKPTPEEIEKGHIVGGLIWDFNNEKGTKSSQGPV